MHGAGVSVYYDYCASSLDRFSTDFLYVGWETYSKQSNTQNDLMRGEVPRPSGQEIIARQKHNKYNKSQKGTAWVCKRCVRGV